MATTRKHILVIGGGPAGIQAALAASGSGCRVTLVSDRPPGGRAVWQTLLPSKMWLEARGQPAGDITHLRARFEQVAGAYQRQMLNDLERAGVDVQLGVASFLSPHEVQITPPEGGYPDQLSADVIVIAAGSVPYLPPGMKPDGERIFSPHQVWKIPRLPGTMIVIGAGGPATEYVDVFSSLGVQVTWITGPVGVLSAFPQDAGRAITMVMERRGVRVITGLLARQIDRTEEGIKVTTADGAGFEADMAFIAIGLRPDLDRLNLPAAGLKAGSSGGLATGPFGQTAVEHIYLVGDAASPLSANVAIAQGRAAGWHVAGLKGEPVRADQVVMAIYTDPQVAMVGRMSDRSGMLQKVRVPFMACLRAHLLPDRMYEEGYLEIAFDSERRLTGAVAVCPEAAEIMTPLAVAIRAGLTLEELASIAPAHPTFTELIVIAARAAR